MKAELPVSEAERLLVLQNYQILDSLPEQAYQDIVELASMICQTPVALVSLVDANRQWFKAKVGVEGVQTERDLAFCAHALLTPDELLVVPDATKDPRFFDNPLVTGDPHIVFYAGAPLKTKSGLVLGTLCVIDHVARSFSSAQHDALLALSRQVMSQLELRRHIAQEQKSQLQLMRAEKMASIGQLAAGVAHEINNPIAFVHSNMNTLSKYSMALFKLVERIQHIVADGGLNSPARQALQDALEEANFDYLRVDIPDLGKGSIDGLNRVREIVDALQNFSREAEMAWQFADLHAGIESTLKIVASTIGKKAVVVRKYGDLPPVKCLASQINQVLMNLLVNAAQSIEHDGVITIETRCIVRHESSGEVRWATIAITDTGSGIEAHDIPHLFDPFFTSKPVGLGTGLGLSVSYNIIDKHSGRIEVDSRPGVGSTFTVYLPLAPV